MSTATALHLFIGVQMIHLWQADRLGDWAILILIFGLVAGIMLAVFVMMLVTYRRDQF